MRKSKLKDGTPFFGIKVECFVTRTRFAKILADYLWTHSKVFDPKIQRKEVMQILQQSLRATGTNGLDTTIWEGASEVFIEPFNNAYEAALQWIDKHYPYLTK